MAWATVNFTSRDDGVARSVDFESGQVARMTCYTDILKDIESTIIRHRETGLARPSRLAGGANISMAFNSCGPFVADTLFLSISRIARRRKSMKRHALASASRCIIPGPPERTALRHQSSEILAERDATAMTIAADFRTSCLRYDQAGSRTCSSFSTATFSSTPSIAATSRAKRSNAAW